jgi:hypothetical protein
MLIKRNNSLIFMEKTVEYQMPKCEFDGLLAHLREEGKYEAHGYFGMKNQNTIDDGSSTSFDQCKRFSTFKIADDESVTLKVENSDLVQTVDSYFANQQ